MAKTKRITAHDVLQKVRTGELQGADLRRLRLPKADLHGALLRGVDLTGANLIRANLRGADLTGASLSAADLRYADLSGATLSEAVLRKARLVGAVLQGARAVRADLDQADMRRTRIVESDLTAARLNGVRGDACLVQSTVLQGAEMKAAEFQNTEWLDSDLRRADLSNGDFFAADWTGVDARGCLARRADFIHARFERVRLAGADFSGADFQGVAFTQVDPAEAKVEGADFWQSRGLSPETLSRLQALGARTPRHWLARAGLFLRGSKSGLGLCGGILFFIVLLLIRGFVHMDRTKLPAPYVADESPPAARMTILCVGDSHTSGEGLSAGLDYPAQLAALLNTKEPQIGFRSINLGRPGDNSSQVVSRTHDEFASPDGKKIDLLIFSGGKNNRHRLIEADFLPAEIRDKPRAIFPFLLERHADFRLSAQTVLNLRKLVARNALATETGWDEVLANDTEDENRLLVRWLEADLERVRQMARERGISLLLLSYFQHIPWVDEAFTQFARSAGVPFVPVYDFGLSSEDAVRCVKDYRPNKYGNARIAEMIYDALCAEQKLGLCQTKPGTTP